MGLVLASQPYCDSWRVESDRIGNLERGNLALCSLSIAPLDRDIQDSGDFRHAVETALVKFLLDCKDFQN